MEPLDQSPPRLEAGTGRKPGLNEVFVELHCSPASGKEGGASVVGNNSKRLFSAL